MHTKFFPPLVQILEVCYKSGVKVVTIYAFSIENFKRSKYEVDALMDMAKVKLSQLAQHGDLLDRYGASVRVLGQRRLIKEDVLEAIDRAVSITAHNSRAVLNVCFPYTSHDEITTAIRNTVVDYSTALPSLQHRPFSEDRITHTIRARHLSAQASRIRARSPASGAASDAEDSSSCNLTSTSSSTTLHPPESPPERLTPTMEDEKGHLNPNPHHFSLPTQEESGIYPDPEAITEKILDDHMFTAGLPPLELLVRTSGVERLSDFMLWQCHQDTEIVFLKCLWPEFDLWTFLPVLVEWQWRKRKVHDAMDRAVSKQSLKKGR